MHVLVLIINVKKVSKGKSASVWNIRNATELQLSAIT